MHNTIQKKSTAIILDSRGISEQLGTKISRY